ncbi:hypothetical protein QCA50_007834 [Cerrena zonata]|uniref:Uncharacterized protein n=1 Tax=Cerrena zonata TaxID=2478898 RepID=A0AAW0G704_9APHY
MHERCAECGGETTWEQELGSAICTTCGTLSNPSQSILASHFEREDTSGRDYSAYWNRSQGLGTLKGRNGWSLAGQDRESRQRRNMITMHEFIRSIASQLSNVGVASRAQAIFDQAMFKGNYNWGRRAKLIGGASIAIALREANKSEALRDIAFLISEEYIPLSQAFTDILELLHLKIASASPSMHITTLQTHCQTILKEPTTFPNDLDVKLKAVSPHLRSISQVATSLSTMLSRLSILQNLPTPPTACAIFMLAIEAEITSPLPHAGAFAQNLGARMGVSQKVVMERYKIIYDAVEALIHEVPWLECHEKRSGRSKVAKRAVVARGLKDVVQFQEQIWRQQMERLSKNTLNLEVDENSDEGELHISSDTSIDARNLPALAASEDPHRSRSDVSKPRTLYQRAIGIASQFLLDPTSQPSVHSRTRRPNIDDDTLSHLLTVDIPSLSHVYHTAPTRLQALTFSRGGEDTIDDDELFEEGELEGFIRSGEEIEILRNALGLDEAKESIVDQSLPAAGASRKRKLSYDGDSADAPPTRKQRIDMNALARILDPDVNLSDDIEANEEGSSNEDALVAGDEVVGEWRPLSPGHSGFDYDRYDS